MWHVSGRNYGQEMSSPSRKNGLGRLGLMSCLRLEWLWGDSQTELCWSKSGQLSLSSDIGGRHVIRLSNSPAHRQDFAQRLRSAGCAINLEGTDWLDAGDLGFNLGPIDQDQELGQGVSSNLENSLSEEAVTLLVAAKNDARRIIQIVRLAVGTQIIVGNTGFVDPMEPRITARWEGAVRDLFVAGLILRGPGGEYYEVTREGYDFIDALDPSDNEA